MYSGLLRLSKGSCICDLVKGLLNRLALKKVKPIANLLELLKNVPLDSENRLLLYISKTFNLNEKFYNRYV